MESLIISVEQMMIAFFSDLQYYLMVISDWIVNCVKLAIISFVAYTTYFVAKMILDVHVPLFISIEADQDILG